MMLYIPTKGRIERQKMWSFLSPEMRKRSFLVCPPDECEAHISRGRQVLARPVSGIANVRQWIVDQAIANGETKIAMADDDLRFYRRIVLHDRHMLVPKPWEIDIMFHNMEQALDQVPLVGISQSSNNDKLIIREKTAGKVYNTRINALYGVRTDILKKHNIKFNAVSLMEDFHVVLSLLELGYKNMLITEFMWKQVSNAPGGCQRDPDIQKAAAMKLASLHSTVSVVQKPAPLTDTWNGKPRYDVRIKWAQAYKSTPTKTLF